jgi:prevent-host-death family protein
MKTIAAGRFKANCLALMDEVQTKRDVIVITKRGKPVAKLVPYTGGADDLFGFFQGKGSVSGDIVSPFLSASEWGNLD